MKNAKCKMQNWGAEDGGGSKPRPYGEGMKMQNAKSGSGERENGERGRAGTEREAILRETFFPKALDYFLTFCYNSTEYNPASRICIRRSFFTPSEGENNHETQLYQGRRRHPRHPCG